MHSRYQKNMNMLSQTEIQKLGDSKVCVIGCGGLGGYVIEMLGRLGVGNITAVDGDVFDESNLNRQLLSDTGVIGKSKAETAKNRMLSVNPLINVVPVSQKLNAENAIEILKANDVVIDAVDNTDTRLLLQHWAAKLGIPMVHGAIAGWYGQVTTVLPGDATLKFLYGRNKSDGIEKELGNPSFTPAFVASIQVSETLKLLIGRGELLRNKVLFVDLLRQEYEVVSL
ncbi:HesA/MoeB/ThiF family protein [Petroclostridium sp. X23]|jgi:molybdopterin/thiamine biosynthesis adenylyltransferase|uniref:HesA/MoeB/ThiF family protein n=1 Tax=Petroclostridium sp. X23 TaxID=3045146 RepID=UPI0024ACB723|nr:HesA/MoeB/ThiF family protein [Petroclostridium sp. X23]WHH58816.1 HesA/MoeB/ThiF family protein [Petroclostridium sp. X23]